MSIKLVALCLLGLVLAPKARAQQDAAYAPLTKAFDALRTHDFDAAIDFFRKAAALVPERADIRKNLAYTLLKTGDSEAARTEFGEAMRLEPADLHVALEYAFLCYEARDEAAARKAEARRIFARIMSTGDAESRATAAQAFQNIDAPLEAGIARWKSVLSTSAPTFSAHYELAQLAEQRDELELAASSYRAAFQLLPERKSVLLELARVEKARGNNDEAMAALLAASRGGEPRAAELAREQLPDRYPYVYEFRKALELDPKNEALHRELAYLLLSMSEKDPTLAPAAEQEFQAVVESAPEDWLGAAQLGLLWLSGGQKDRAMPLLENVLSHADAATANRVRMALNRPLILENRDGVGSEAQSQIDARTLGERSYKAGFLKDAKRYFLTAHEENPSDAAIALKLGWTDNLLHDDASAVRWFDIARHSDDPAIAAEAARAWGNLKPGVETFRTTVWIYPLYSSRWSDVFGYGQIKTEYRQKKLAGLHPGLHPYVSVRLAGDARRSTGGISPQSLSESAFIVGAGISTDPWHRVTGWFEAGEMIGYLDGAHSADFRGGGSYARTLGASLSAESGGWFFETTDDGVFISHFQNDVLGYSQNKVGYTLPPASLRTQIFWNSNFTADTQRQYWANFAETGPGVRFHFPHTPRVMTLTVGLVRGAYLTNVGNPRRPNFTDVRAGVWYAFTK